MPRARPPRLPALSLVLAALLFSCRTTTSEAPAGMDSHEARRGLPHRAWQLSEGGAVLGTVVQFADPSWPKDPGRQFYSVRNAWHQELGHVDAFGRAWRFVPHQPEPAFVGTGTLLEGVQRVLDAPSSSELREVPPASLGSGT